MIKFPNLQTLEISAYDFTSLKKALVDSHAGENPLALVLEPSTSIKTTEEFIETLKTVFSKLNINPKLPYPIFIVTTHSIQSNDFPIVSSKDKITSYYRLKLKKLKKRESNLLSKVGTYTTRINHYRVDESMEVINQHSKKHKLLKAVCKEKSFYLNIMEKIEDAQKRS